MVRLSVITVTYNSGKFIRRYLTSLMENLPEDAEVMILDSGSSDQTVDLIKNHLLYKSKKVRLIEKSENVGYGKGNNEAAREARGEYLFLLNPDTEVIHGALDKLLEYAENNEFGIIGPKLIEPNGKIQPSVRKFPTLRGAIKEYWFGQKSSYEGYVPQTKGPIGVECVLGAAILIKRELFEELGGFDEDYFMYFEDLDLCRRVHGLGKKVIYLPTAVIKHEVGGSMESNKITWIKESENRFLGSFRAFLISMIGRIGHKFLSDRF